MPVTIQNADQPLEDGPRHRQRRADQHGAEYARQAEIAHDEELVFTAAPDHRFDDIEERDAIAAQSHSPDRQGGEHDEGDTGKGEHTVVEAQGEEVAAANGDVPRFAWTLGEIDRCHG
jgi:hypothetical protein